MEAKGLQIKRATYRKPEKIELGKAEGKLVKLNLGQSLNGHIAISGSSGAGKSVTGQKIICRLTEAGGTVIVFDMHRLFAEENVFPPLRSDLQAYQNDIDVYEKGLSIPFFTPLQSADGRGEDTDDAINALATTIATPLRLGCRQKADLLRAIRYVAREGIYENQGIAALDEGLNLVGSEVAATVRDKLHYILKRNVFRGGDFFLYDGFINILRLSDFDVSTQALISELVLSYLWRKAQAGHFVDKPVWLFCDECQNLSFGNKGILHQILQEGRKLGLNLILITPQTDRRMLSLLGQAGTQLYFLPNQPDAVAIAKTLSAGQWKDLVWQVRSLHKGQVFAVGALEVNGNPIRQPLLIKT